LATLATFSHLPVYGALAQLKSHVPPPVALHVGVAFA
jgi:hypothetical protein